MSKLAGFIGGRSEVSDFLKLSSGFIFIVGCTLPRLALNLLETLEFNPGVSATIGFSKLSLFISFIIARFSY